MPTIKLKIVSIQKFQCTPTILPPLSNVQHDSWLILFTLFLKQLRQPVPALHYIQVSLAYHYWFHGFHFQFILQQLIRIMTDTQMCTVKEGHHTDLEKELGTSILSCSKLKKHATCVSGLSVNYVGRPPSLNTRKLPVYLSPCCSM